MYIYYVYFVYYIAVDEKLHWSFKLYDLDGNGEIDVVKITVLVIKYKLL